MITTVLSRADLSHAVAARRPFCRVFAPWFAPPLFSRRVSPRSRLLALAAILTLAAVLRFVGLSAGLRHTPFIDEQFFVVNVEGMLERGDLDHRFHMYPGFFFYLLTPALAFVPRPFGPSAYLVARHVVAAFGVATVGLVYVLGARIGTVRAGLLGAALLAVSPVAVTVAHEVRPDIALGFFAMVALLSIVGIDGNWRRDAQSGFAVGMATAIKFTGVTLAAPYVIRRLTVAGNLARGLAIAGALSLVAYTVLSPYSFLHFDDFVEGVMLQKSYHDEVRARGVQTFTDIAGVYGSHIVPNALGAPALLAALFGLWATRSSWRITLPIAALPLAMIAVLSTAQIHRSRYLLASFGALAVLAGLGLDAVWKRSRWLGVALVLIAIGAPLTTAVRDVSALTRPSTLDRALDWTTENAATGNRVATMLTQIGLDRGRFELVPVQDWSSPGRHTAAHSDVVIATVDAARPPFPGFARRFEAHPAHPLEGPPIEVLTRATTEATTRLDLRGASLNASENTGRLPLIVDGDHGTRWETQETQTSGMWVEVALTAPRVIDRIELLLGGRPNQWGRHLEIALSEDGRTWMPVKTTPGRAMVSEQVADARGHSQVLILSTPTSAKAVRIRLTGGGPPRWGFAEVEIYALTAPS
jgi:hypothetical protein